MGKTKQPVWQFRADGTYVRKVESMSEAARLVDSFTSNIKAACEIHNKVGGFYWRYAEGRHPIKIEVPTGRRGGKKVLVYKITGRNKTNLPFICNSIGEAARLTNVSESTIRAICKNERKDFQGKYKFEFVNKEDKDNFLPAFDLYDKKFERKVPLNKTSVKLTEIKTGKEFVFESINEAARKLNINDKGIRHVLANRYKKTKGYLVQRISE